MDLGELKRRVRDIGASYTDREHRARRLFIEERPAYQGADRAREFKIKTKIAEQFRISYSAVNFCGSAQIGFSIHKDRLFIPASSDLDVACVDVTLFQEAWKDVVSRTNAFTDMTPFGSRPISEIDGFKDQLLRRGMIRINAMPESLLSRRWSIFQDSLGRSHADLFRTITIAIYINEYAFCWKQDSALSQLLG